MSPAGLSRTPSQASVVKTLRDGYWERTELIQLDDGSLRVRKASKGTCAPGPWGTDTLRAEMRYMTTLPAGAAKHFPKVLAAWDDGPRLGYEMSYLEGAQDVAAIARSSGMSQPEADAFQDRLGVVVFDLLHQPVVPARSLAAHVRAAAEHALARLARQGEFSPLVGAQTVSVNGQRVSGPHRAMRQLVEEGTLLRALDGSPQVRLHGDLFLENILLPAGGADAGHGGGLTLIDPVSVAGVFEGTPLFDLVKYESYATGELPAMRSEKVRIEGFDGRSGGDYVYRVLEDDPAIQPFRRVDWHGRFRAAYVRKYGGIGLGVYHLLDAYFALVMALSTRGLHRRARVLKATLALNDALAASST